MIKALRNLWSLLNILTTASQRKSELCAHIKVLSILLISFCSLLPKDPLKRAYIRYFIEIFSSKVNSEFFKFIFNIKEENARIEYEKNIGASFERVRRMLTNLYT